MWIMQKDGLIIHVTTLKPIGTRMYYDDNHRRYVSINSIKAIYDYDPIQLRQQISDKYAPRKDIQLGQI